MSRRKSVKSLSIHILYILMPMQCHAMPCFLIMFTKSHDRLDPIAVIEVADMRKETKVIRRSNAPKWDASFSFNVTKANIEKGDSFVEVSPQVSHQESDAGQ